MLCRRLREPLETRVVKPFPGTGAECAGAKDKYHGSDHDLRSTNENETQFSTVPVGHDDDNCASGYSNETGNGQRRARACGQKVNQFQPTPRVLRIGATDDRKARDKQHQSDKDGRCSHPLVPTVIRETQRHAPCDQGFETCKRQGDPDETTTQFDAFRQVEILVREHHRDTHGNHAVLNECCNAHLRLPRPQ